MAIDIILVIIGVIFVGLGLAGCILPVIPGPPLSFVGLLMLHFTRYAQYSSEFLILMAFIAVAVTVLDYLVPIWGTRKFGGSKAGVWGATLGLIVGLFFPPVGLILGPFLGAFAFEAMKAQGKDNQKSFKAALGSLFGFMLGVGLKLIASFVMTFYFFKELFVK